MIIVKIENGLPTGEPYQMPKRTGSIGNPRLCDMLDCAEYIAPEYNPETHNPGEYTPSGEAWTHDVVPLSGEVLAQIETDRKTMMISATKYEAERRILAIIPEWKQRNATARAVEILNARMAGTATETDETELTAIHEIYKQVAAIRGASDLIEAEIEAGAITDTEQIQASTIWP